MDFELSEDQLALRQAAADLLDSACDLTRVRQVADGEEHLDRKLWQAMAEQGWAAVELADDQGGLGLGAVEVSILAEQVGRHLAPVPFLGTVLAVGALNAAASIPDSADVPASTLAGTALAEWVARLSGGEAVGSLAWSQRLTALSATPVTNSGAMDSAEQWYVSGRTDPVVYAPVADVVVAPALCDGEVALFALAPSTPPVAEPAMDRTRSLGRLVLEGEPAVRLGGEVMVERLLDRAATGLCAEMLGAAERVLHMTVDYAKDRVQFGRAIGSFQAVKHRCADMLVDVEGMRSAAYFAAWAVGAGDPDAAAASSAAKVWCSDASRRVMASGLQVHGGIGFTWEHDLHLFVKRAQLDQVSFGDARAHRERLAAILRPRAEAGLPVL
ncbi:MAG TPA: acyl-CoA dehydrogenase [Acidimicrobiaceae bacterium]|nr:acyl-CoA dehydrogenase [Acidimicrobiaceae bacterium]